MSATEWSKWCNMILLRLRSLSCLRVLAPSHYYNYVAYVYSLHITFHSSLHIHGYHYIQTLATHIYPLSILSGIL